jgi:hypothetical protein
MRQRLGHYSGSRPYEPRYPWRFGGERDYEPGDSSFGSPATNAVLAAQLAKIRFATEHALRKIRFATEHSLARTLK